MSGEARAAEEVDRLETGAGFLRPEDAGLVRVTGPGHRDALQRVLSQDLRTLSPGGGCLALLLAPKGQFRAIMAVFGGAEETILMAPPGRAGELATALRKYLSLSRCDAEPVADAGGAVALVGERWAETAVELGADAAVLTAGGWHAGALGSRPVTWFGRPMLGVPGVVVVGAGDAVVGALRVQGVEPVLRQTVELERIRRGSPAWGAELTETVLPPEVGIDAAAISYSKGCYLGQETIARMKTYGHPTRALVGLRQLRGEAVPPGLPFPLVPPGEDKTCGALTSWARHPGHGGVGLALVRTAHAAAGTRLAGAGRDFEVAGFPLW